LREQLVSATPIFGKHIFILIDCWFVFVRLKSHYKVDGTLKASTPWYRLQADDVDSPIKLVLVFLYTLQASVYAKGDMYIITSLHIHKRYMLHALGHWMAKQSSELMLKNE
jgi:hypothetical protein